MAASTGNTRGHCYIMRCVGLVLLALHFAEADETSTTTEIRKNVLKGIKSLTAPSTDGLNENSLPTNVEPLHYSLLIHPNIEGDDPSNFTFRGIVQILIKCHVESSEILLHSEGLNLDHGRSNFWNDETENSHEFNIDLIQEKFSPYLKINLNANMKVGTLYWISLFYYGHLRDDYKGLYFTQYKSKKMTRYAIASRFIPNYARTAFPCFDEPALKASFYLIIIRPQREYVTLTNTVLKSSKLETLDTGEQNMHDRFKKSPRMSTFGLAIFIGDFEVMMEQNEFQYRSFTKRPDGSQANYARKSAKELLNAYEQHFGIKYGAEKSDIVAVPEAETSLHWGLDLFKETSILNADSEQVEHEKAEMDLLMGQKTAHAYFGNLVTPLWWNDVWLMEGMSSYFQYYGPIFLDPKWKTWDKFILDKVQVAFQLDSVLHDKAVIRRAETEAEIKGMLDWVVYTKAPVLIRMMKFIVRDNVFDTAVKNYIKKWQNNATTTKDLFAEIETEVKADGSNVNVSEIMDTWLLKPNYPLVTVTRDFHNHSLIRVEQKRFLSDPMEGGLDANGGTQYRWTIPLTFMTSLAPNAEKTIDDTYWLDQHQVYREMTINNDLSGCTDPDGWILLNVNQVGYYRVNYQTGNWLALSKQLRTKHNVIPTINRAQIMNDAWALTKAEHYIPINIALETLDYLEAEREFLPWQTATAEFQYLESRLSYTPIYGGLKMFMRKKVHTPYIVLKKTDPDIQSYALIQVAEQACYYDIYECVNHAKEHYKGLMNTPENNQIPPQVRQLINCISIANGDWKEFSLAVRFFNIAESEPKKLDYLYAMSCSRKPWILNVLLSLLLDNMVVISPENALSLITFVIKNPYGRYLAWDYYRANYDELYEKYPTLACHVALPVITQLFNTNMEASEVGLFSLDKCLKYGDASEKPFITILENIQWTKENSPIIKAWLLGKGHFIL